MGYNKFSGQYKKTGIVTSGKMDLIIMCYDKAIQSIHLAKMSYEANEFEKKASALQKALNIINELQGCLDFEKGGQISTNLDSLYSYLTRRLIEGDLKGDLANFDEAIKILSELNEAWQQIAQREEKPDASASPPSYSPENRMGAQITA